MKALLFLAAIALSGAFAAGQAPTTGPAMAAPHTYSSPLGFSYSIPGDWEVVNSEPTLPEVKQKAAESAASEEEKKGVACVQVGLTARHGDPSSVIVEVALPFDCFGQQLTEADLPGFASGASDGIKKNFDTGDPVTGTYMLGAHHLWIERVPATPKGDPERKYTIEVSCALITKAAVCWMTMASDDISLAIFEHGAVTLDGDPPTALVPATAFQQQKP
jgi:hypothetical protein